MKKISKIIVITAIALISYGYWGAFTESGNKVYDEMDGYYPFFMLLLGVLILFINFIVLFIKRRKMRN